MALRELNFTFTPDDPRPLPVGWFHRGVTGSGDMEVMLEQRNLAGDVQVKVCTPVVGFDEVWERVLENLLLRRTHCEPPRGISLPRRRTPPPCGR